jgi:hypothetical protein
MHEDASTSTSTASTPTFTPTSSSYYNTSFTLSDQECSGDHNTRTCCLHTIHKENNKAPQAPRSLVPQAQSIQEPQTSRSPTNTLHMPNMHLPPSNNRLHPLGAFQATAWKTVRRTAAMHPASRPQPLSAKRRSSLQDVRGLVHGCAARHSWRTQGQRRMS